MNEHSEFANVASLIGPGEWTTYGDIAAAAGVPRSARAVGREAATDDDFPNAHRVLRHDGTVARERLPDAERARDLLEREGVTFSTSGRADPAARIHWDELQRRGAPGKGSRKASSTKQ